MNLPFASVSRGRARWARPLLCVSLLSFAALLLAPSAQAALVAPLLTGSDPGSPGSSLTPRIKGEIPEDGGTKVMFGGLRAGPVTKGGGNLADTLRLYAQPGCAGPIVGEGTVGELEGAGVQVSVAVAEDAATTFFARQSNGIEDDSPCSSAGFRYRQVTTPPAAPTLDAVNPASPADENSPRLIGVADPDASVSIHLGADCGGAVVGTGSAATFGSSGIQVTVPDNSETTFSARATLTVNFPGGATGDFASGCSAASLTYQEVTPPSTPGEGGGGSGGGGGAPGGGGGGVVSPGKPAPPPSAPRLRTIPGGWANNNTPVLTGSAPGAVSVRIYADPKCGGSPVAKVSAEELAAGIPVRVVDNDVTVFSAVGDSGRSSPCSEPVVYVEDSLTPRTRITMAPGGKTAKRKAIVRFMDTTGNAPGTTFLCRVDKRGWKPCVSPLRLRNLKLKRYVVQVKATDPAGNVETRGAKRSFKVIARP